MLSKYLQSNISLKPMFGLAIRVIWAVVSHMFFESISFGFPSIYKWYEYPCFREFLTGLLEQVALVCSELTNIPISQHCIVCSNMKQNFSWLLLHDHRIDEIYCCWDVIAGESSSLVVADYLFHVYCGCTGVTKNNRVVLNCHWSWFFAHGERECLVVLDSFSRTTIRSNSSASTLMMFSISTLSLWNFADVSHWTLVIYAEMSAHNYVQ